MGREGDVTWTGEEGVGVVQLVVLKLRGLSVSDPFTGLPMVAAVIPVITYSSLNVRLSNMMLYEVYHWLRGIAAPLVKTGPSSCVEESVSQHHRC